MLFVGPSFYASELDPIVRKKLQSKKLQLSHWSTMYNLGLRSMPPIIGLGIAAAAAAFHESRENYWIYGAAAFFSILPYTLFALMPLNNRLEAILAETKKEEGNPNEDLEEDKAKEVTKGMDKWVKLNRVRGFLALGAAGLFLVARALTKK